MEIGKNREKPGNVLIFPHFSQMCSLFRNMLFLANFGQICPGHKVPIPTPGLLRPPNHPIMPFSAIRAVTENYDLLPPNHPITPENSKSRLLRFYDHKIGQLCHFWQQVRVTKNYDLRFTTSESGSTAKILKSN